MGISKQRNIKLDLLKTIAIVGVVLYHFGFQTYGYLGVDIFLVLNGFFIAEGLKRDSEKGELNYFKFLFKRLFRLYPLVLLCGLLSVAVGFFVMLPDDFENLSESVVASNLFANNILSCITTGNYWNVANDFKPLMHFWYLGVLMQCYIVLPIVPIFFRAVKKGSRKTVGAAFAVITLLSFALYLFFPVKKAKLFYYMPFRLFELTLGCAVSYFKEELLSGIKRLKNGGLIACEALCIIIIAALLLAPSLPISDKARLTLMCVATAAVIPLLLEDNLSFGKIGDKILYIASLVGKASFSVYVWHSTVIQRLFRLMCLM